MSDYISIAIDGPAGVGKSTIAKALARNLGFTYVDTGAMYRAVTLFSLEQGIPVDADHQQEMLATALTEEFTFKFADEGLRIFYGARDLTEDVRSQAVTAQVSHVAALPEIRKGLSSLQRQIAMSRNVVMEGRDIGSAVLPEASYKFFLTAAVGVRAQRRHREYLAKGVEIEFAAVLAEIEGRDRMDSTRKHSPLVQPPDAIVVDTSGMNVEEVLCFLLSELKSLCQEEKNDI